jgi:XTP/dITP diphosphohydrolase
LLADLGLDVWLLADVPGATLPAETGASYHENALAKARAAVQQTGMRAIADDSGLEVDALGGAPGVRSARYGGSGLDDAGRVARLLEALCGVPDDRRTARFRCVIALVERDGRERIVEGAVEGTIIGAPRGTAGFGYDPVFLYPPLGGTFAELTGQEKARVSHRGRAVAALRRLLAG